MAYIEEKFQKVELEYRTHICNILKLDVMTKIRKSIKKLKNTKKLLMECLLIIRQ